MDYLFHIAVIINVYAIAAMSLNLISGYTGMLSLSHAAFFGIGAYSTALMGMFFGTGFWVNILVATALTGILSIIVAYPALRIFDDYFVIATFGLQVIIHNLFRNWDELTSGSLGISGIQDIVIFNLKIDSVFEYFLLSTLIVTLIYFILSRLVDSKYGLILRGIREDQVFTWSAGKNVTSYKIQVLLIGGALVGVSGALYAHFISYIEPNNFSVNESIFMLSIVIIGGAGNLRGSLIASVILIAFPELLRFVGLPPSVAANLRQIFYGLLLILFMLYRSNGVLGVFDFGTDRNEEPNS